MLSSAWSAARSATLTVGIPTHPMKAHITHQGLPAMCGSYSLLGSSMGRKANRGLGLQGVAGSCRRCRCCGGKFKEASFGASRTSRRL